MLIRSKCNHAFLKHPIHLDLAVASEEKALRKELSGKNLTLRSGSAALRHLNPIKWIHKVFLKFVCISRLVDMVSSNHCIKYDFVQHLCIRYISCLNHPVKLRIKNDRKCYQTKFGRLNLCSARLLSGL